MPSQVTKVPTFRRPRMISMNPIKITLVCPCFFFGWTNQPPILWQRWLGWGNPKKNPWIYVQLRWNRGIFGERLANGTVRLAVVETEEKLLIDFVKKNASGTDGFFLGEIRFYLSWMISKVKTRLVNRAMNVRELGWNKPVMGYSL